MILETHPLRLVALVVELLLENDGDHAAALVRDKGLCCHEGVAINVGHRTGVVEWCHDQLLKSLTAALYVLGLTTSTTL
jgi:hypothetical protein